MSKVTPHPFTSPFRKLTRNPLIGRFAHLYSATSNALTQQGQKLPIGWGYKRSGRFAKYHAPSSSQGFLLFEDGFIRSLYPGYHHGVRYSLVADSTGIYYDASGESDLIRFLNGDMTAPSFWSEEPAPREAVKSLELLRHSKASKYNCHLSHPLSFAEGVLVVDQTKGDAAIRFGGMAPSDYDRMLSDAIDENPESIIYVKTHPDHRYRKKKSCFTAHLLKHSRVHILPANIAAADCFAFCTKVYVGTSLMGMEALIHHCEVITYGWNFYAGWGLTTDRSTFPAPPRKKTLTLAELFTASYLRYTHYFDPDSGEPCKLNHILYHIQLQHKQWGKHPDHYLTYGLSPWKKSVLPKYTFPSKAKVHAQSNSQLEEHFREPSKIYTWGKTSLPDKFSDHIPTRIEDGFIRSRGLGAKFNFPLSWVFDDLGIYFDATSPSKLEHILENHEFSDKEITQASELAEFLREQKLTKYNLGIETATLPRTALGKRVILIPGQVDSDASIQFGSPQLKNNRELIDEVRKQHPEAFICYKPHPDLLAGARSDAPLWQGIEKQVDHLVMEGDIISWIQAVDEVHTLTSTVGMEALLHNKPVFTYGLPFYAGWGLTTDWLSCPRRSQKRTLAELVAAAYLIYPTYLNPQSGEFTTALQAAKILSNPDFNHDSRPTHLRVLGELKALYYKWRKKLKM